MNKKFNIYRNKMGFLVESGSKEIRLTMEQVDALISFFKKNMKLFAYYFEEVKWYIRFLESPADYFSYEKETGYYRTEFRPYLYGEENAVEKFKEIFSDKNIELDFFDRMSCKVYSKNKKTLKENTEKFYNVIVIPYLTTLFDMPIYDIVGEYKALSEKEIDIINRYF